MKTFKDLEFKQHAHVPGGVQARLDLGFDVTISVVSMKNREGEFGGLYGDVSEGTYEVAAFHNDGMVALSRYDDVIGWQTTEEVDTLMEEIQTDVMHFLDLAERRKETRDW